MKSRGKEVKELRFMPLITRQLNDDVAESRKMANAVFNALRCFSNGDWGKIDQEDKDANNADLEARDGHVLGRYSTPKGDIYINLVFDEPSLQSDVAVIMYCDEY